MKTIMKYKTAILSFTVCLFSSCGSISSILNHFLFMLLRMHIDEMEAGLQSGIWIKQ